MSDLEKLKESLRPPGNLQTLDFKDGKAIYSKICNVTGVEYSVEITEDEYARREHGEHIQNVCPHLSADEREFIISAITPAEWKQMFGPWH